LALSTAEAGKTLGAYRLAFHRPLFRLPPWRQAAAPLPRNGWDYGFIRHVQRSNSIHHHATLERVDLEA